MTPTDSIQPWYRSRVFLPATAIGAGILFGLVQARGGDPTGGAISFAILFAWGAVLFAFSNRSEVIAVLAGRPRDERYAGFDLQATAFTGVVLVLCTLGGFLWEVGQGRSGNPYMWLAAVGGLAYLGAILFQRFRR